jgi:DNA-binding SARP family transcriptional activator
MRFRVLGPLEVLSDDNWQTIGARKWRSLLAALLLHPGHTVSVDTLIDAIWGDEPPAKAANLVSIYVLRLRRLLGDSEGQLLVTRSPGYLIRAEPDDVDAVLFEQLAEDGRRVLGADPERAAVILGEALKLWRGEALADVPASPFIEAETERLSELRLATAELRVDADLECGRFAQVIPELRGTLSANPLRERLWLLLMRALDGDGRRAEALDAYAQAREAIADQLGVDPGADLRRLYAQLLAADQAADQADQTDAAPRRRASRPPVPTTEPEPAAPTSEAPDSATDTASGDERSRPDDVSLPVGSVAVGSVPESVPPVPEVQSPIPRPQQLPADIGDFTGRRELVDHLSWLLSAQDAVANPGAVPVAVIAGSGGLGKTSLAVHAAHKLTRLYSDGQLYVDLLGATEHPQAPSDVLARFLRDLGVQGNQVPAGKDERSALYRTRLAGRRVLVLLDNARDAAQVRSLLPGSSSCGVLVTARSRMPDLAQSRLVDLAVLDDDESLTLFTKIIGGERAAAEPEATAEVLVACAGLPLAIRICAARLTARSHWSIKTLARRLAVQHRRLDELRVGDLAVRASFEVSVRSLPSTQAGKDASQLFGMLGLWPGPFITVEAAAALVGQDVDRMDEALEVLVDACLLECPASNIFRFHDLLRAYAVERAQEEEIQLERVEALRRAAQWYLYTVDAAADHVSPHRTRIPLGPVPEDCHPLSFANLDEALEWLEAERPNLVAVSKQAAAEGLDDLAWRLPPAAMTFFNRRGYRGDWIATHQVALESARRLPDPAGEAMVLNSLGMAYRDIDLEAAIDALNQAITLSRASGDLRLGAQAGANLADTYLRARRYADVTGMHQQVLEDLRSLGNRYGEGIILTTAGEAYLKLGGAEQAIGFLSQSRQIFGEIHERRGEALALECLGDAHLELGQLDEGLECLRLAVEVARSAGERVVEAACLRQLGSAYGRAGQSDRAREALLRAQDLFRNLGDSIEVAEIKGELDLLVP